MFRTISIFSAAAILIAATTDTVAASNVFPARGYGLDAYSSLSQIGQDGLCVAHSAEGAKAMMEDHAQEQRCSAFVFLGAAPSKDTELDAPCIVVGGDMVSGAPFLVPSWQSPT